MKNSRLEIIKCTPYLFSCDGTRKDFLYLVNKLDKLNSDLIQMQKLSSQKSVDIDYLLDAIHNDSY